MGNFVSCTLSAAMGSHARGAKVILPDGSVRQVDGPASAAEMMLDSPGYLVVNSRAMQVGRRFSPLSADEDLEMGDVYLMLPMARANSVVAAADVGRLLMAANMAARRAAGGSARVLPDSLLIASPEPAGDWRERPAPRLKLDDVVGGSEVGEFKYRLSMCRSRRPVLETIAEESICSR